MELENKLINWLKKITNNKEALSIAEQSEERIIRTYKELLSGYDSDPSKILKITKHLNEDYKGLVIEKDINFYSICGHHFIPFFGKMDIVYEPGEIIVGIGKLKRLADVYARRLQIQEDLVKQVAEELMSSGKAKGVYVFSRAKHLCVCGRGPNDDNAETIATYSCGSLEGIEQENRILNLFKHNKNL